MARITRCCRLICSGSLVVVIVSLSAIGWAQTDRCDHRLKPLGGHTGYGLRGNRCEGLYISTVSSQTLELISLLQGKLQYRLDRGEQLTISAPDVSAIVSGPIQVRAVARPLKTYYRMDATLPVNRKMAWTVRDVLLPSRLTADRIGVYGWVDAGPERYFVPLRVGSESAGSPSQFIEVMVRSTVDVDKLVWRATPQGERPSPWQEAASHFPAGRVVTLTLPSGPKTVLRLELAAKAQNRDTWGKLILRVIRDAP